jgi:hypothetical protein
LKNAHPILADDYDGDSVSDPVVFRPNDGGSGNSTWYTKRSMSGSQQGVCWGLNGDLPVFGADYDGDRIADPAVMGTRSGVTSFFIHPSTGTCPWPFVEHAATQGCYFNPGWGSSMVPVPADYDGDGITDIAARSTSCGTSCALYFIPSSGTCPTGAGFTTSSAGAYGGVTGCYATLGDGLSSDKPLVADWDGDGKTDITFHRPSPASIYTRLSSGTSAPSCTSLHMAGTSPDCYTNMNSTSDIPVTADFDGDGKTDIMWWNPPTGYFRTWGTSSSGSAPHFAWDGATLQYYYPFGLSSDVPLAKRFDNGDTLAEPTLYRPSTGDWGVTRSGSTGPNGSFWNFAATDIYTTQWGLSGDKVEGLR